MLLDVSIKGKSESLSTSPVATVPAKDIAEVVSEKPIQVISNENKGEAVNGNGHSKEKAVNGASHKLDESETTNGNHADGTDRPLLNGLHSHKSLHGKAHTLIPKPRMTNKRIIVCCDGTWQDGIEKKYRWQYSNILKLARAFHREDTRHDPPVHQVVFYQSGVGTDNNLFDKVVGGATGEGLAEKVQDAYCFIAHNYAPGDEIFLLGFSRGAYTARMVAEFIGAIGILNKNEMDHFAEIFINYQKLGKETDEEERKKLTEKIARFTADKSPGKLNAEHNRDFSIRCVAVFDTVGAIGLPGELVIAAPKTQLFGFNDLNLGAHVERALQALALNERRSDFSPATWKQTDEGRKKGQTLQQCWFTGSHSDIGGGYEFHDLSDITMAWMVANFEDILAIDEEYIKSLYDGHHCAAYGEQLPHDSSTGVFTLADAEDRPLPKSTNELTHETIHPSVLECKSMRPDVIALLKAQPSLLWKLKPFEEQIKATWQFDPTKLPKSREGKEAYNEEKGELKSYQNYFDSMKSRAGSFLRRASIRRSVSTTSNGTMTKKMNRASVQIVPEPRSKGSLSWFGAILDDISG